MPYRGSLRDPGFGGLELANLCAHFFEIGLPVGAPTDDDHLFQLMATTLSN
jgi:hypothetical protein